MELSNSHWKAIAKNTGKKVDEYNMLLVSAGIAFFMFLSLFPTIAALASIYGLLTDAQQVQRQIAEIAAVLPEQSEKVISNILKTVVNKSGKSLGWGAVLSIIVSFWIANNGTRSMFKGVNIAYNTDDSRNVIKENAITLLFTVAAIVVFVICIALIVGFSALEDSIYLHQLWNFIIKWGRWLVLGAIIISSISLVYRYAPVNKTPGIRWVGLGAGIATFLWLIGSILFSIFVKNFANMDNTFGPIAGIIILLLWFLLTSFSILLGALINAEAEFHTGKSKDT